jgi:hypothetical protein
VQAGAVKAHREEHDVDSSVSPAQKGDDMTIRALKEPRLTTRALAEAGGGFAGGAFLGGAYFGLTGAVLGSILGFVIGLLATRGRSGR